MPGSSMEARSRAGTRNGRVALVVAGVVLLAVCVYRASLGISFFDDGHYAAITLHLAQGARPFADEMTTQVLGFLLAVPFAKAWTTLFGLTGFVLALRVFYVIVSAGVACAVYRLLKPSFGMVSAALGAVVPCLVPPYNIFGISYNTTAMLGLVLGAALCLASVRERSARLAALAGASSAFAAVSYPPLAICAIVLALSYALVARSRRLVLAALGGAFVIVAIFAVWLLGTARMSDIQHALEYSQTVWQSYRPPAEKITAVLRFARRALFTRWTLPAWILGLVAALPGLCHRLRSLAAALVPVACLIPAARVFALGGSVQQFGANGAAYLVLFAATALLPVAAESIRRRDTESLQGLALTAPLGIIGYMVVAYWTSSGWLSAVPVIAVAPLGVMVLAGWSRLAATGARSRAALAALIAGAFVVLLFATAFGDASPLTLDRRFASGALAGIATTSERMAVIDRIVSAGARWSTPTDTVLVAGRPLGYLLVPGRARTNAIWLVMGPSDRYTVEYFSEHGAPDVVYINRSVIDSVGGLERAAGKDPLVGFLARQYTLVETFDPLAIFVRR